MKTEEPPGSRDGYRSLRLGEICINELMASHSNLIIDKRKLLIYSQFVQPYFVIATMSEGYLKIHSKYDNIRK